MPTLSFRQGQATEAATIAALVNQAYQPAPNAAGWTHEADLVCGDRVRADQVVAAIAKPDSVVLLGLIGVEIAACVHLEKTGRHCHMGMFAVNPARQGTGLGKQLLAQAERYAQHTLDCDRYVMQVIAARTELLAFYVRRGYQKTGLRSDYASIPGASTAKIMGLQVETLEKPAP